MRGQDRIRLWLAGPAADARWLAGDPLLASVRKFGAAVILAAGPWLVSVAALAIISVTMTPAMGFAAVEDLRLTVVYAFCIAPLVAGPIGAVAARRISAALDGGETAPVAEIFLAAAALSGAGAQIIAIAISLCLGIGPSGVAAGFVFLSTVAALLWTSFAVLAAVYSYAFLIAAFTGGMILSVACALLAAIHEPTTELLIWSFAVGVSLCVILSMRHVQKRFPCEFETFVPTFIGLLRQLRANLALCAGVFFAICGVWIDKWVFWFGPEGARSAAGFLHSSSYDSVMFFAHLSVIPTYAALLVFHHGELLAIIERFRSSIEARSTYGLIRDRLDKLEESVWSGVFTIAFVQAAVTIGLVLMAPLLAKILDLSFGQFLMLRVGLIAVFFHAVIFLCCALLLVANRLRHFALIQAIFLLLNFGLSLILHATIGMSAYAFLISSLLGSTAAFYAAYRAIHSYDYNLFLGENDSLFQNDSASFRLILSQLNSKLCALSFNLKRSLRRFVHPQVENKGQKFKQSISWSYRQQDNKGDTINPAG
ncbi:exopolysaccharide Pel transporter PelG [Paracoccus sp. TK19116]|uniref:Exopolysaccharide Pel transporter PelG n=1 Tax=Paracoccus albicereus TaxID=2922394 RepID=A0ABT1MTC0_9RHOB|nr:exopolysaccharide Pel transporter PelG [Paracoccus albicereus]MCQ0971426.1 exopolysaccharide Pel transporter PelG [Paracoccus albicereus]